MALAKPAGAWTYEDLFVLPDDGKRYEIIEGELYEMPSPTSAHAITIANLVTMLIPLLMRLGGRWLTAPLDVFVPGGIQSSQTFSSSCQTARRRSCRAG